MTTAPAPKAKNAPAAAPATGAAAPSSAFKIETGFEIPARTTFGGGAKAPDYPFADMPVGASFLVGVTVPDTIKDDAERAKAFKEEARKASNRISGAIRRFRKNNEGYDFAIRTVNDDKLGHGVRVWRAEQEAANAAE
jgi:hypothetical protein